MEMKFHSQAQVQYVCSFLKVIKTETAPKRMESLTRPPGHSPLVGWEGREPVPGVTLATSLRVKDGCVPD